MSKTFKDGYRARKAIKQHKELREDPQFRVKIVKDKRIQQRRKHKLSFREMQKEIQEEDNGYFDISTS